MYPLFDDRLAQGLGLMAVFHFQFVIEIADVVLGGADSDE